MKRVFIKVVNGNHQECIDYLASLGGKNRSNWRGTTWADSYCIDSEGDVGWVDESGWGWCAANGYTEIFLPEIAPSKHHPHYSLIVQWASDPTQKVWKSHNVSSWTLCETPKWIAEDKYYVGETPPPNLEPVLWGGMGFDVVYCVADPTRSELHQRKQNFVKSEKHLFDRKLVYSTPKGAIKRAKEMLGMTD